MRVPIYGLDGTDTDETIRDTAANAFSNLKDQRVTLQAFRLQF